MNLAHPAFRTLLDLLTGARVVIDGALHQPHHLILRRHGVDLFEFVLGEHGGRSRHRTARQLQQDFQFRNQALARQPEGGHQKNRESKNQPFAPHANRMTGFGRR